MDKNIPPKNVPQGIPPPDIEQHIADFSSIKQGFEASVDGLTPPKFLWDIIDQELQADLQTDAPEAFSSIKQGFEDSFQTQSAPLFAWEALEEDAPTTPDQGYSVIKRSFEHQYGSVIVPLFSWEDLTQRMDQEALESDTPDQYSRVKEGYATFYATHHPVSTVWQNILRQLHPRTAWWQANRQRIGGVLMALVLVGAALWGANLQENNWGVPVLTGVETSRSSKAEMRARSIITRERLFPPVTVDNTSWGLDSTTTSKETNTTEISLDELLSSNVTYEQEVTQNKEDMKKQEELTNVVRASSPRHRSTIPSTNSATALLPDDQIETWMPGHSQVSTNHRALHLLEQKDQNNKTNHLETTTPTPTTMIGGVLNILPVEQELLGEPINEQPSLTPSSTETEWLEGISDQLKGTTTSQWLPTQWQTQLEDASIDFVERNSFSTTHQALKGKRLRIEFGLVGRFGTSMLVHSEDHCQSRISREFGPSTALGFTGQVYLGKNSAFTLSGYPSVFTWHSMKEDDCPNHPDRTSVEFTFMEVALGYQHVLWHYSLIGEMPSRVYARIELGAAWMIRSNTQVNRGSRHQSAWYTNLQYSTGLSFGTTHTFGKIVIDYGITGNLGLNSIVSTEHPSLPQPTRLFQIGGFVSLRYMLMPRLAPSKRMRQFDWSPPFYIEEPVY